MAAKGAKMRSEETRTPLTIEDVRALCESHEYEEIQFNEQSRVVAFKNVSRNVRVNIYYTTGTVATCLLHPGRQARTQLFRRGVSLRELDEVLQNPRTHTGKGYFQVPSQHRDRPPRWFLNGNKRGSFHDDVCRWEHVLGAVGYPEQQTHAILSFVKNFTRLFFEETREGEHWAGCYFLFMCSSWSKKYLKSEVCVDKNGTRLDLCVCEPGWAMMEGKEEQLKKLEAQFSSLNRDMKKELLVFYFEKVALKLFPDGVFNAKGEPVDSFLVDWHVEYGECAYAELDKNICPCHGQM